MESRIKMLREKRGLIQELLAVEIGVTQQMCIFHLSSASFPEIQSTQIRYFRAGISAL